jgi:hypothetical protein
MGKGVEGSNLWIGFLLQQCRAHHTVHDRLAQVMKTCLYIASICMFRLRLTENLPVLRVLHSCCNTYVCMYIVKLYQFTLIRPIGQKLNTNWWFRKYTLDIPTTPKVHNQSRSNEIWIKTIHYDSVTLQTVIWMLLKLLNTYSESEEFTDEWGLSYAQ